MAGILVIAERKDLAWELLNIGRQLASQVATTLTAAVTGQEDNAQNHIARGADEVLLMSTLPEGQAFDAWIPVIAAEAKKADPDMILLAATARGKDFAARLAAHLGTGLCSNCIALSRGEDGTVVMERLAYGGAAVQQVSCVTRPVMATIPTRTFAPAPADHSRSGEIRKLSLPSPSPVRIVARKVKERSSQDITEAKVVVCVGRGMEKEEDIHIARQLADLVRGEIGCTRPISEELHWLPDDLCIGLSGVQVKPDLYIGLGVSGQIQHVTGIRGARVICAVNKDENAPIFQAADLGIVGDLYDVTPKLIEELQKATRR
ncbi:MAG: electron transfer flavoprotein subunit alpha/FixB family protein [Syntrophales bacterium]|jgi:electron transfer flavoprotein alpha subunit|nr:electron transfer flavoprotein subunit alpha/FixB family protein [Syntrophales bacterium]MCK9391866.1 electron transfer flavoprotein subunit alpha/FixB family protein [Syntrophales bacterium]